MSRARQDVNQLAYLVSKNYDLPPVSAACVRISSFLSTCSANPLKFHAHRLHLRDSLPGMVRLRGHFECCHCDTVTLVPGSGTQVLNGLGGVEGCPQSVITWSQAVFENSKQLMREFGESCEHAKQKLVSLCGAYFHAGKVRLNAKFSIASPCAPFVVVSAVIGTACAEKCGGVAPWLGHLPASGKSKSTSVLWRIVFSHVGRTARFVPGCRLRLERGPGERRRLESRLEHVS